MNVRRSSAVAAALFSVAAMAQQPPTPPPSFAASNLGESGVRAMAANCAACHGTDGHPADGSSVPRLASRPAAEIVDKVKAFKEGKAEATVMHQIAKGFSDAEVAALAAYFARQP